MKSSLTRLLILICFLSFNLSNVKAQEVVFPKDALIEPVFRAPLLTKKDTIFVKVEAYNQKLIVHEVGHGQTLYSIARFYGISFSDLMFYNMHLQGNYIHVGQKLNIPISNNHIIRKKDTAFIDSLYAPVFYKVRKGETLYRISNVYFRMSTDLLKFNNQRESNAISVGDPILIGWFNIKGVPDSLVNLGNHSVLFEANSKLRHYYVRQRQSKREYNEDGVAFWNSKESISSSPSLYALHNKAPLNSVIRIFNPMTNRALFAKVVGRIPKWTYDDTVKVILPPSAAKSLGAIDPRFHVKIQYLK